MHDDTGMKFSENFGHREIYQEISCMFAGTGSGMPMYPRNIYEIWSLNIWLLEEFPGNAGSIILKLLWPVVGHVLVSSS